MFRPAIAISALAAVTLITAACQHSPAPASVAGECKIFADPGFRVLGATPDDQSWINRTQETGIRSCGWLRPAKRQVIDLPTTPPLPLHQRTAEP